MVLYNWLQKFGNNFFEDKLKMGHLKFINLLEFV